jgi:hypothetical protein
MTRACNAGACAQPRPLEWVRAVPPLHWRGCGGPVPYLHVHAVRVGALDLHASHLIAYTLWPAGQSRRRRAAACVRRRLLLRWSGVVRGTQRYAEVRQSAYAEHIARRAGYFDHPRRRRRRGRRRLDRHDRLREIPERAPPSMRVGAWVRGCVRVRACACACVSERVRAPFHRPVENCHVANLGYSNVLVST